MIGDTWESVSNHVCGLIFSRLFGQPILDKCSHLVATYSEFLLLIAAVGGFLFSLVHRHIQRVFYLNQIQFMGVLTASIGANSYFAVRRC